VAFADRTITGTPLQILLQPGGSRRRSAGRGRQLHDAHVDERAPRSSIAREVNADLSPFSEPLPSPYHSTLIAPLLGPIRPLTAGVGEIVWEVTGAKPHRELVVEWRNLEGSDVFCELFGGYVTFQAVFFEDRSDILFNYRDTTFGGDCPDLDGGATATVGIQVSPDAATMFSFHTAALAEGTSLLWTLGQAPQPAIGVTPASQEFGTVAVDSAADKTVVVTNAGTGTMTGQATAARAVQHRVRRRVLARRRPDPGGDRALQPDDGRARSPATSRSPVAPARRPVNGSGAAANVTPDLPAALGQFKADGTTALAAGAWTNQTSIVLKFTMVDASPVDTLTPEVEVKSLGTAFTGAGLLSGAAVASTGAPVQGVVSVTGLTNGSQYHWRARTRDAAGQTSGWVSFGGTAESARDVGIDTSAPTGSIVVANGSTWTRTSPVTLTLKCTDTRSGCSQMQLAQDAGAFTFRSRSPEPRSGPVRRRRQEDGVGPLHRRGGERLGVDLGYDHARHHGSRGERCRRQPEPVPARCEDDEDRLPRRRRAVGHVSRGHPHPRRRRPPREDLQQERAVLGRRHPHVDHLGRPHHGPRARAARNVHDRGGRDGRRGQRLGRRAGKRGRAVRAGEVARRLSTAEFSRRMSADGAALGGRREREGSVAAIRSPASSTVSGTRRTTDPALRKPERKGLRRERSTVPAPGAAARSSTSTALPFRRRCSSRRCSA
jgi:hypothetical protein